MKKARKECEDLTERYVRCRRSTEIYLAVKWRDNSTPICLCSAEVLPDDVLLTVSPWSDFSRTAFTTWNQVGLPHELSFQTQKHWHDIPKNKQCRHEKTLRAKSEHTFAQATTYNTTYMVCAFVIWSYVCSLAWHTFWADIVKCPLPTQWLRNISSIYLLQLLIWLEAKIKAQEFLDYICRINQMLMLKHKEKDSFPICY